MNRENSLLRDHRKTTESSQCILQILEIVHGIPIELIHYHPSLVALKLLTTLYANRSYFILLLELKRKSNSLLL